MARVFNTAAGARRFDRTRGCKPCEVCGASASPFVAYNVVAPGPEPMLVGTCGSQYCRARAALTKQCEHEGAAVRNCPYSGDVDNDSTQRCRCCEACAHQCGMDI